MGGVQDRARNIIAKITGGSTCGTPVIFTNPVTFETATVNCLIANISQENFRSPNAISGVDISMSVSEQVLNGAGYTTRNVDGYVYLKKHLVEFIDSEGFTIKGYVKEVKADSTIGLIVLYIGNRQDL